MIVTTEWVCQICCSSLFWSYVSDEDELLFKGMGSFTEAHRLEEFVVADWSPDSLL